jgi:hypothetical protein
MAPARVHALSRLGLSPRFLSREEAAAYVGVSVDTFTAEVAAGQWPMPRKRGVKGFRVTWDRCLLDAFADRDSGLAAAPAPWPAAEPFRPPGGPLPPGEAAAAAAEAAALRGVQNAPPPHGPKHRQPQAA